MLEPSCERCGCALDARAVQAAAPAIAPAWSPPPLAALAMRRAAVLLGALTLYAAGKLGYDAAGASGALIAFGAAGYLALPFVPERIP
jgi:hypothetical protein